MKERGILLPIFSLPSKYGVGDFGYEAYEFIDILSENGINYWELLPINSYNDSPYSPTSYYALEETYISLDKLIDMNLIKEAETRANTGHAIYDNFKDKYFKEAYDNFNKNQENAEYKEYEEFKKFDEIIKYAKFMSEDTGESIDYHQFLQFICYKQWVELKKYANSKNIKIIGDMPMYPEFLSVDTKFDSEYFEMENGKFSFEAGTPPDYFNSDGQKWDSPVYNVDKMKKDNFKYLVNRFKYHLKLFDIIRIDYFRGYDSFYKIPIGGSGKEGFYVDGVGYAFFDELFKDGTVSIDNIFIEDLGDIREETKKLREYYGFTRQKILQFTIDLDNLYDKDNEFENVLVFAGNHDCNTIYGWYKSLSDYYKGRLKDFLRLNNCNDINVNIGLMQYLMKCKAGIAIITVQDVIGLDEKNRINIPGTTSDDNWSWELIDFNDFRERVKDFR